MSRAFAYSRQFAADPLDALRIALVSGCAIALIAAGQAFPL